MGGKGLDGQDRQDRQDGQEAGDTGTPREGFARRSRKSCLHFLNIAESSLAEAGYCIQAARRLGYIGGDLLKEFERDINGVGAPLAGLVRRRKAI
jgi:four helix bundle protein